MAEKESSHEATRTRRSVLSTVLLVLGGAVIGAATVALVVVATADSTDELQASVAPLVADDSSSSPPTREIDPGADQPPSDQNGTSQEAGASVATTDPDAADDDVQDATASEAPTVASSASAPATAGTTPFVEAFDDPSSLERFDWAIHHGWQANQTHQTWNGDHSLDCGPPDPGRAIQNLAKIDDGISYYRDTFHDSAYWCRGHLMTSLNTNHYGQVDFSPRQIFTDVERVCWDQNRTDLGGRQWTQMVVVPLDTFEANDSRMDYVSRRLPTNPGPGTSSVQVTGDTFLVAINRGGTQVQVGSNLVSDRTGGSWRTTDKMTRHTICVTDQNDGTVRVELGYDDGVHVRILEGGMPDGPTRVIFQDDTYNADKDLGVPGGYTWHWDNIMIFEAGDLQG